MRFTQAKGVTYVVAKFNVVLKSPWITTETTIRVPFLGIPNKKPYEYTVHETSKLAVICYAASVEDFEISTANYCGSQTIRCHFHLKTEAINITAHKHIVGTSKKRERQ